METQKTISSQRAILRKKDKVGGTTFPNFKLYDKVIVIKTVTQKLLEQNREPSNKPPIYGQLIYDKGGKTAHTAPVMDRARRSSAVLLSHRVRGNL